MEAILGAADFDADEAERYGWINRALPDAELDAFVARLARRIASFPAEAVRSTKRCSTSLTLPGADVIRADHDQPVTGQGRSRCEAMITRLPRGPKVPIWNRRPGARGR